MKIKFSIRKVKMNLMFRFFKDEKGATAVEYAALVALIAGVIVGVVAVMGTQVLALYQSLVGKF